MNLILQFKIKSSLENIDEDENNAIYIEEPIV